MPTAMIEPAPSSSGGEHPVGARGLDIGMFASVLENSSLASEFFRMKLPKLAPRNFAVHGAIDVGR